MTMGNALTWILALVLYSGPLVPSLALLFTLSFRRVSRARCREIGRPLAVLTGLQGLMFLPYGLALMKGSPESLHALSLPFFPGVLMFFGTSIYAVVAICFFGRCDDA